MATFPTNPKPRGVSIKSLNQVYASMFQNFNLEKRSNGAQRWEITLTYPTMNFTNGKSLFAFIMARRGSLESFDFKLPAPLNVSSGLYSGGPFAVATDTSYGSTVPVSGLGIGTGLLKAGDLVQFSNHEKVYMLTADIDSADGTANMLIMPPLMGTVTAATETVNANDNVIMKAALTEKNQTLSVDENTFYSIRELKIVEAFNVPVGLV